MSDIKCASDAHVWCKNICILKARYDCLDGWNVRQEFRLPRLNEYHGCMDDSILKSHESFILNNRLRGMCSIPSGKDSINRWKSKWARMLCCHDKRKHDYAFEDHMRTIVNNHELTDFNVKMYVRCKICLWYIHIGLWLCMWLSASWMKINKTRNMCGKIIWIHNKDACFYSLWNIW